MLSSSLERAFETRWLQYAPKDIPEPTQQVYFHPERDWKWDFGWVDKLIVLDLHGGGWLEGRKKGAHNRELGMVNDMEKHNAALIFGWRPVLATTSMISDNPQAVIDVIVALWRQPILTPNAERVMWFTRLRNLTKIGASILNNGIRVERGSGAKFLVKTSSGEYKVGGSKLKLPEARQQVLDLILKTQKKSSPVTTELASRTQFTTNLIAEKLG